MFTFEECCENDVRQKIDEGFNVCVHVYAGGARQEGRHARYIMNLDKTLGPATEPFVPCAGTVGSCDACFADYDLTIKKGRLGWVITVRAYHRVGAGRETTDLAWTCGGPNDLTEGYGDYLCRRRERPTRKGAEMPCDEVKRRWMQDVGGYAESSA